MPIGRTNTFPESGRGLGHVTPTVFGSTVGYYPSDSLVSCSMIPPSDRRTDGRANSRDIIVEFNSLTRSRERRTSDDRPECQLELPSGRTIDLTVAVTSRLSSQQFVEGNH